MAETLEIVPVNEVNDEIVTSDQKVEYSVKSEVISTVTTHETVTCVTEVRTENETVENHVESIESTIEEIKPIENGEAEDDEKKEEDVAEEEKPKENGESEAEETPAAVVVVEDAKIEASSDVVVEAAPADETSPEEEIQEEPPKVLLHQLPRVKGIVSASPQCLSLETYLKMAEIPYENVYEDKANDVTKENTGKLPYIAYKKTKVEGLKNCITFLKNQFDVETDKHLSAQDEAMAHAFRTMMEESTYWSLVYYRWVDNYKESKKMFNKLPPVMNVVSPKMFQNKCKKSIENHVIGRHNCEELYNIAEQDLGALSAFLGDKVYFMGDLPASFDAVAFGLLANFDYGAMKSPQQVLIREKLPNLHEFCERMKEKYWVDWSDICGDDKFQEKPKSSLVKRLSFRSRNKGRKTAKEGEKSEPTSPASDEKNEDETKENGEPTENGEATENGETKENGEAEENKVGSEDKVEKPAEESKENTGEDESKSD